MVQEKGSTAVTINRIWRLFSLRPNRSKTFKPSADPDFVEQDARSRRALRGPVAASHRFLHGGEVAGPGPGPHPALVAAASRPRQAAHQPLVIARLPASLTSRALRQSAPSCNARDTRQKNLRHRGTESTLRRQLRVAASLKTTAAGTAAAATRFAMREKTWDANCQKCEKLC